MVTRRQFLHGSSATMLGTALVTRAGAAVLPEAAQQASAATQPPLAPATGRPYNPVVTLNGWTLPWRMRQGWKEFHLVAEPVVSGNCSQGKCWGSKGRFVFQTANTRCSNLRMQWPMAMSPRLPRALRRA